MIEKKLFKSLDELEASIQDLIQTKNYESALNNIKNFVALFLSDERLIRELFSSPILDRLCTQIGEAIFDSHHILTKVLPQNISTNLNIYIATMIYRWGGHSACLSDIIQAQPEKKHIILLTAANLDVLEENVLHYFESINAKIIVSPYTSSVETVLWLQQTLDDLQPEKIFLFNHHIDSPAIAAMQPKYLSRAIFYHHADHNLCLGVHLDCAQHIDPHPMGYHNCKEKLAIRKNIYIPLCSSDRGHRHDIGFSKEQKKIKTCTSGSRNKFESPYLYNYFSLIPAILENSSGIHYHIGELSMQSLEKIENDLVNAGISKDRFIYMPWVESLSRALIENEIDLFITSFPLGGGKACIEAMSAGIPLAVHSNYISQFYGCTCLCYPEAFCWKKPQELLNFLKNLNNEFLKNQSLCARTHYEKYHHPQILELEMNKPVEKMRGLTVPKLPNFIPNSLQINLYNLESMQNKMQVFESLQVEKVQLTNKISELNQILHELQVNYKNLESAFKTVLSSKCWYITKPIRYLSPSLSRLASNAGLTRSGR